jgi:5-methylcytosine-specific restriction endonuclease McrA
VKKDWHHLYNRAAWKRLRAAQLTAQPLCEMCKKAGRDEVATVVDHKKAHKGDEKLFFDRKNLQSLCKTHHDAAKQREEHRGVVSGCDENGFPLDPGHHWGNG